MRGDFDVNKSLYPVGISTHGHDLVAKDYITGTEHAREEAHPVGTPERDAQWDRMEKLCHSINEYIRAVPSRATAENIPLDPNRKLEPLKYLDPGALTA